MATGIEDYRGFSILWDITESDAEKDTWHAQAAMVPSADKSGIAELISDIKGDRFHSELEARDYVVQAARQRVDEILRESKKSL
jgi:hypothetical protein